MSKRVSKRRGSARKVGRKSSKKRKASISPEVLESQEAFETEVISDTDVEGED